MENYTFSHRVTDISSLISVDSHGRVCVPFDRFFFLLSRNTKKVFPFFELQQPKEKINSIKEKRKSCLFSFRVIPGRLTSHLRVEWRDGNTSPDGNATVDALPKLSSQVTFTFYFKLRIKLRRKVLSGIAKNYKIKTFWFLFFLLPGGKLKKRSIIKTKE